MLIEKIKLENISYLKGRLTIDEIYYAEFDVLIDVNTLEFVGTAYGNDFIIGRQTDRNLLKLEFYHITDMRTYVEDLPYITDLSEGRTYISKIEEYFKILEGSTLQNFCSYNFKSSQGLSFSFTGIGDSSKKFEVLKKAKFLLD